MKKRYNLIYWIATIWLALGMLSTAGVQLFKGKTGAGGLDMIAHLGYPIYFITILAVWKILGSIAILIPKFTLLKEWAYAGFFFAMSGAILSHTIVGDGFKDMAPALLLLLLTVVSWYYRPAARKIVLTTQS